MQSVVFILLFVACITAAWGVVSLTQATQGAGLLALACFLGILARIAQAGGHQGGAKADTDSVSKSAGFVRPPLEGEWPPKVGERFSLTVQLELRATPGQTATRTGIVPPGTRLVVLRVQGQRWLYLQTEDGHTEGWAETNTR